MKTLADLFTAAALPGVPDWASEVTLAFPPMRHQVEDLVDLSQHTRRMLNSEMGTGKTFSLQAYALWLAGLGNKTVFLMPPILLPQFQASLLNTFQGVEKFIRSETFNQGPKKREALLAQWQQGAPDFLVVSYKIFKAHHVELKQLGYNSLIVDEAQAVKNQSSTISKCVKIFAGRQGPESNGLVLATGTPVENAPIDAFNLINLIDNSIYGSQRAFESVHCIKAGVGYGGSLAIVGYHNLEFLHGVLRKLGRRVLKKDVLGLPPVTITEYPVTLSPAHLGLYKQLVEERLALLPDDEVIDLTNASALYQATQRALLVPETYTKKPIENTLLEMMDSLLEQAEGNKVVVFAWYQESIAKIMARYKRLNPAVLNGEVTGKAREQQKQKFIKDPTCMLLAANPRSAGIGVDGLQEVCSIAIYAEVCPFPGVFQQSLSRLHRSGQTAASVSVYLLVARQTIAVKLRNDLLKKDADQEAALVDKRTILKQLLGADGLQGNF